MSFDSFLARAMTGDEDAIHALRSCYELSHAKFIELNGMSLVDASQTYFCIEQYRKFSESLTNSILDPSDKDKAELERLNLMIHGACKSGKSNIDIAYMSAAISLGLLSYSNRRKVGCVIVKNNSIISYGYNGTAEGEHNSCEDSYGCTHSDVDHAEDNALAKLISSPESAEGSTVYVTDAPCKKCARLIVRSKVSRVVYLSDYKVTDGVDYMNRKELMVDNFGTLYPDMISIRAFVGENT